MLDQLFFDRDCKELAKALIGKVLRRKFQGIWLSAIIVETEAYYLDDKASHASLGFTEKKRALFMEPGTIYMYYARGGTGLDLLTHSNGH
ncbi:MAG: DNA-3-methyladenine glycosylase [Oligoflexales bacterium]|nr:DNA-3-methyladenine glycosylase [Oligoflexales bacterium]